MLRQLPQVACSDYSVSSVRSHNAKKWLVPMTMIELLIATVIVILAIRWSWKKIRDTVNLVPSPELSDQDNPF
jgi:hypothetical protein